MDFIRNLIQRYNPKLSLEDIIGYDLGGSYLPLSYRSPPLQEIPVDILDEWEFSESWDRGLIYQIDQPCVDERKYIVRICFPNWSNEYNISLTIWDTDTNENDDKYRIAPPKTMAFYDWEHPFSSPCVIAYYVSSGKRKHRGWNTATIVDIDDKKFVTVMYHLGNNNKYNTQVEPWNSKKIQMYHSKIQFMKGAKMYAYFQRIEKQIFVDIKNEKRRRKRENIAKRKQKHLLHAKLKQEKKIVLNNETVQFMKTKPMQVSRHCIAFKEGWINIFGIPKTWKNTSQKNYMEDNVCTTIYKYLDKSALLNYSATCKYSRQLLFDKNTLLYLKNIFDAGKKRSQEKLDKHVNEIKTIETCDDWKKGISNMKSALSHKWQLNENGLIHWTKLSDSYNTLLKYQEETSLLISKVRKYKTMTRLQNEMSKFIHRVLK